MKRMQNDDSTDSSELSYGNGPTQDDDICHVLNEASDLNNHYNDVACSSQHTPLEVVNNNDDVPVSLHEEVVPDHVNLNIDSDSHSEPYSDTPSCSESDTEESFVDKVHVWATSFNVKGTTVDSILKILSENGHPEVPLSSRTLLKTL